ncbi:MAG: preprotein translocase subunit YajC [Sodalis sp. (in: enterobacteria)]
MSFFISDAIATTGDASQTSPYSLVVMVVIFCLIFYFMILRPQKKRAKVHKGLMNSISKGDEILTTSGFVGRVVKVTDSDYISIALNETNEVVIKRDFVSAILPKGTVKGL